METFWQSEQILFDGDDFFDCLIRDIDEAKSYITVEVYIFRDDILGRKLAMHLIAAQERGVKVQIIVDGMGSHDFSEKLQLLFQRKNIQVKVFNPLPFYHPFYGELTYLRKIQVMFARLIRINKRNHRKIITIDQRIMYTGSFNFTAEHTRFHHDKKWKDMGVRVSGEQVVYGVLNFKKNWKLRDYYRYKKHARRVQIPHWRHSPLRLNQTVFMRRYFYKNLLSRINKAEKIIWLTTPYFIPKRKFIKLLGKAAERGVDTRLLVSFKSDVKLFRTLQYFYYGSLIKKGVKIYHYTDTVLHAKNYIIDDWITIGSSNLNHRSLLHDLEVDLIIQDDVNKELIKKKFIESTSEKNSISIEDLNRRPFFDRFLSRLLFTFKYWF